jgi:hypothetical protein
MKKRLTKAQTVDLPWEYDVVGEHRSDPSRILMRGTDGRYYELRLGDGEVTTVELGNDWVSDTTACRMVTRPVVASSTSRRGQ